MINMWNFKGDLTKNKTTFLKNGRTLRKNGCMVKQDKQFTYKRNTETRSRNHSCRGKGKVLNVMNVFILALILQHAKRMRRIISSSVA